MFETLFTRPAVLRRHKEGPLAVERARYLTDLAAKSVARTTLLRRASCCRRVAVRASTMALPTGASTKTRSRRWLPDTLRAGPTSSNTRQYAKGILPVCDDRFLTKSRPPAFHSYVLCRIGTTVSGSDPLPEQTPNWHANSELLSFLAALLGFSHYVANLAAVSSSDGRCRGLRHIIEITT